MNPSLGMAIVLATALAIVLIGLLVRVVTAMRRGETLKSALIGHTDPDAQRGTARSWLLALVLCVVFAGGVLSLVLWLS